MTPELFAEIGISSALGLLPPLMDTVEARAMILAICLQESDLMARRQFNGPARGYAQFELTGIAGVLEHRASGSLARRLCLDLDIGPTAPAVYEAIEFHDVLTCGFTRLNLLRLPQRLPTRHEADEGFRQYLSVWKPGRPRPQTWPDCFDAAWAIAEAD